ncbi:hypothetical protein BKA69DRAFT_1121501 [Paraphysoderma sedebokerense]|nr:hypothetical protein BKA69DRAFT_1121501 [Paraphysoderma sedebokerense]
MHHPPRKYYSSSTLKPPWIPSSPSKSHHSGRHTTATSCGHNEDELVKALRQQSKELMRKLKSNKKVVDNSQKIEEKIQSVSSDLYSVLLTDLQSTFTSSSIPPNSTSSDYSRTFSVPVPPSLPKSPTSSSKRVRIELPEEELQEDLGNTNSGTGMWMAKERTKRKGKPKRSQNNTAEIREQLFRDALREMSGGGRARENVNSLNSESSALSSQKHSFPVTLMSEAESKESIEEEELPLPPPKPTDPSVFQQFLFSSSPERPMHIQSSPSSSPLNKKHRSHSGAPAEPPSIPLIRPASPSRDALYKTDSYYIDLQSFRKSHPRLFFGENEGNVDSNKPMKDSNAGDQKSPKSTRLPSSSSCSVDVEDEISPQLNQYTAGYFTVDPRLYITPMSNPFDTISTSISATQTHPSHRFQKEMNQNVRDKRNKQVLGAGGEGGKYVGGVITDEEIMKRLDKKAQEEEQEFMMDFEPPVK